MCHTALSQAPRNKTHFSTVIRLISTFRPWSDLEHGSGACWLRLWLYDPLLQWKKPWSSSLSALLEWRMNALMQERVARLSLDDADGCPTDCRPRRFGSPCRGRLLQHRRHHEQKHLTAVPSRSLTSFGRSGLAGTSERRCCRATSRTQTLTCTKRCYRKKERLR